MKDIQRDCSVSKDGKISKITEFTKEALLSPDPFDTKACHLDESTLKNIEWRKSKTNDEARAYRETQIQQIEQLGDTMWKNKCVEKWMQNADPWTKQICRNVNGPLLEKLAKDAGHHDIECVSFFRFGAQIAGDLPRTTQESCKAKASLSVEQLKVERRKRNQQTMQTLKEDKHSKALLEEIRKDVDEGRMTNPRSASPEDLESVLLAKRFSVEQGVKDDGSTKIRAIDDETASGLNLCTQGGHKIRCNNVDYLVKAIHEYSFYSGGFKKLSLWKADVKAAYRRIPITPEQRWMAWVALMVEGEIKIARHNSMMFGAIGSVIGWDRVGDLLTTIATKILNIPLFRWVDDYFSVEPSGTAEHAKMVFARLLRATLGHDAIEDKKLEHGNPLTILGVDVKVNSDEVIVWPTQAKLDTWKKELEDCKERGVMSPGLASKMAGRLNFAAQNCFKRFGRAMIRPFYAQQYAPSRNNGCSPTLLSAMNWWLRIFDCNLTQAISLKHKHRNIDMFCDASGSPPRIAAVVIDKYSIEHCAMDVLPTVAEKFEQRNDKQIMGMELLAILAGIETFKDKCQGARVRIWTDNIGGECALRKQACKAVDHNALVHLVWTKAAELNAGLFINRVPSCENIADGPTRPDEEISSLVLHKLGAARRDCKLPGELSGPSNIKDCI